MGLEVATNISQLVEANPLGTDNRAQGDDHIRLIKGCLKTTFPGVTTTVTSTSAQLNQLAAPGTVCFPGMIVMWSGNVASIPAGWKLCNGVGTTTVGTVPNLVNRFIVASGGDAGFAFNTNQIGGDYTHAHSVTVNGTALTVDQIPPHTHAIYANDSLGAGGGSNPDAILSGSYYVGDTRSTGGGTAHSHTASTALGSNIPTYYSLAFLIKN